MVGQLTFIQPRVALLLDDAAYGLGHALLLAVAGDVHLALDGDVRVGDGGGEELAEGAEEEGHGGRDVALAAGLEHVLHLLEEGVLQYGVDDEDEGGDDAAEEGQRALLPEQGHERADGGGRPRAALHGLGAAAFDDELLRGRERLLARRHARVDDPDGVRQDHGRGPRQRARHHGLGRRQLPRRPPGLGGGGLLEEGPRPLVPVVVDEVGHADAEHGAVEPRVEAGDALARDDALHGRQEVGLGSARLDLGARGERDERVSVVAGLLVVGRLLSGQGVFLLCSWRRGRKRAR